MLTMRIKYIFIRFLHFMLEKTFEQKSVLCFYFYIIIIFLFLFEEMITDIIKQ